VSAWYDAQNDKVFVVAENQRSKLLTQFTVWHELGHAKVNVAGRDEWNRVLRDAYRSDAMFRKLTNQIMAKRADTADKLGAMWLPLRKRLWWNSTRLIRRANMVF